MSAVSRSPISVQGRCSCTEAQPGLGARQGRGWVRAGKTGSGGASEAKRVWVLLFIQGTILVRTAVGDYVNQCGDGESVNLTEVIPGWL